MARQLCIAVVLTQGIFIVFLVWHFIGHEGEALENYRRERAEGVAGMLATSGAPWVLSQDVAELQELVRASASMKALRYSMFVDLNGRVLAHTRAEFSGQYLTDPQSKSLEAGRPTLRLIAHTADAIEVAAPVIDDGTLAGWARASISLTDLQSLKRDIVIRGIAFGVAATLLCMIAALFAARTLTRRLENLAAISERFRRGERSVRIGNIGDDEVAATARGIDEMLETVAQTEQSLKDAHRIAQLGSWQFDPAERKLSLSHEVYTMFRLDPAGPRLDFDDFLSPLPRLQKDSIFKLAAEGTEGETSNFILPVRLPDGTQRLFWVEARVECRFDRAKLLVGVCQDITDREAAAAQLRQAQKMEAVGQLTGGIAHDFNNLLSITIGNLDLLEEQLPADSATRELVDEALGAAVRGSELTQQLLAFSRRQPLSPQSISLNEMIEGISTIWRRTVGEKIKVKIELADDLWLTKADPAQVQTAALNLVINARDAMPDGGNLTVETTNCRVEAGDELEITTGEYCVITVSDTGEGMSPETMARSCEPFFTTKEVGRGSGLGLSMVYGFAKQSGGHLKIYSELGHGTAVRMYLPRADGADDRGNGIAETAPMPQARNNEMVLLVEDDEGVRRIVDRQLSELGYKVLCASSGVEALDCLDGGLRVDLLFTDIVMGGGMDGIELARVATERKPALKVLHTSGFTSAATLESTTVKRLLSKPYRKTALAAAVREALDAEPNTEIRVL